MPSSDHPSRWKAAYLCAYVAILVFIAIRIADYHHPVYGYSWLPLFGEQFSSHELPRLLEADRYIYPNSYGYDGQFYAQMALYPSGVHEDLASTPIYNHYRTRRYLLSWTAWVAGGGDPTAVIQAYSFQNAVFWLGIALLLLRWLPPNSLQNLLRYSACLFTLGLVESWTRALLDGPALFLTALGVLFLEMRRPWLSSLVFGVSGLAKETNILAIAALPLPNLRARKEVFVYIGKACLVVAPIALWLVFLYTTVPLGSKASSLAGSRNFDWPLFAWFDAVIESVSYLKRDFSLLAVLTSKLFLLVAILVQFVCLIAFPRRSSAWWRIGIAFTALGTVLGGAVWEGDVSAAAFRVLLPVTIAFNILLPRSAKLLPVLIIANLPSVAGIVAFDPQPPDDRSHFFKGIEIDKIGEIEFQGWQARQSGTHHPSRWTNGPARVSLINTSDGPLYVTLGYSIRALKPSTITISFDNLKVEDIPIRDGAWVRNVTRVRLAPGSNTLVFETDQPPPTELENDRFSFCLLDFRVLEQLDPRALSAGDIPPSLEHQFQSGWHKAESDQHNQWQWSSEPTAAITIINREGMELPVNMCFDLRSISAGTANLSFKDSDIATLDLRDLGWHPVSLELQVPPGSHTFSLHTRIDGESPSGDSRMLYLCVRDFEITQLVPTPDAEQAE